MTRRYESAYPCVIPDTTADFAEQTGLSKRELFAAMALQGLLAADSDFTGSLEDFIKSVTKTSVLYADALINALNGQ